jgi:hypothetical protein
MLDAMRVFARDESTVAHIVRDVAIPVSEAVLAHRKRDYRRAVDLMRPVLGGMYRLGGSHAQQDVLFQLCADAAVKADCADDVRLIVKRAGWDLSDRVGYSAAARFAH